jgi:hypothetical protein
MTPIYQNVATGMAKFFEALESLEKVTDLYPGCGATIPVRHDHQTVGQFVFTDVELWVFEPVTEDET